MRLSKIFAGISLLTAAFVTPILAAEAGDKSQYSIFNPTPPEAMRKMVSDQAMFTLTPYTVDAGHYQLETDVVDYFWDRNTQGKNDIRTTGWAFGRMTLKAGLCDRTDFELSFWAYSEFATRDRKAGTKSVERGFSNLTSSMKINLWGNEEGTTALAVLPYVTFPTTQLTPGYEDYTGGALLPLSVELPCQFTLGLMTGFELSENTAHDIHPSFINGISLRRPMVEKLDAYAEFYTSIEEETGSWSGVVNAGAAYRLAKNIEVHAGATFGVHNEYDFNPYIGFSCRF